MSTEIIQLLRNATAHVNPTIAFTTPFTDDHGVQLPDDQQLLQYRQRLSTAAAHLKGEIEKSRQFFKKEARDPIAVSYLAALANAQQTALDPNLDPSLAAIQIDGLFKAISNDTSLKSYMDAQASVKAAPAVQETATAAFASFAYLMVSGKRTAVLIDNTKRRELHGAGTVDKDAPSYNILDLQSAKTLMANRQIVQIDPKGHERKVNVVDLYLESPLRRDLFGVTMLPGCDDRVHKGMFNMWQGWAVEPLEGKDDQPFWTLIEALCNGNQEYFTFFKKYLAHMIQRPAERPMCAIGISGPQGIGKTSFARVVGALMHESHYNDTMTMEDITGRFTGSLATTLFGFLDEASWGGDVAGAGRLKSFITALNDRIEFKGVDSFKVPTYKRVIFASNDSYYYHADADDRRLLPLEPTGETINKTNTEFWKDFWAAFNDGQMLANLMYTLQNEDVEDWVPHAALQKLTITTGSTMAERAMDSVQRWVKHCLNMKCFEHTERVDGNDFVLQTTSSRVPASILQKSYSYYCSQASLDRARQTNLNEAKAALLLREVFGAPITISIAGDKSKGRKFDWNSARAVFVSKFRFKIEWDDDAIEDHGDVPLQLAKTFSIA